MFLLFLKSPHTTHSMKRINSPGSTPPPSEERRAERDAATSTTELGATSPAGTRYQTDTRGVQQRTVGTSSDTVRTPVQEERRRAQRSHRSRGTRERERAKESPEQLRQQQRAHAELSKLKGQTESLAQAQKTIGRLAHEIAGTDHPVLDEWLLELHLAQYCSAFKKYHITPAQVPHLV